MDTRAKKRAAARAALRYVEDDMMLGVGTGSTVEEFIVALSESRIRLRGAVSSSNATSARLREIGIPELDLNSAGDLPLYVDGADQATPQAALIKGGGGALAREKIVAAASARFVCIIDDGKLVDVLGAFPLPVEVIPMARAYVARRMVAIGGRPVWREGYVTDNGNVILDVHGLRIDEPLDLETRIDQIAGVVAVGLFARRGADELIVAGDGGVRHVVR